MTMTGEIQGTKKEFIKIFNEMCYSRSGWQVWSDLISTMACSIANAVDRSEPRFSNREKEYAHCIERLGGVDKPAKCFAIVVEALERNPEQDFLGELYMELELGNHWKGQFFTPYCVCKMMSEITVGDVDRQIEENGYISICDPACGAGATLIAAVNSMRNAKHNFQNHVLFVGQDIDRIVGMMCYIQLSLLGCAGYICIGNTITNPLGGMRHIVTAELIDDKKILLLNFFEIQALKKGKTEAAFRTFLSHDDYITQDLKTSKTKWLTASFAGMYNFSLMDYVWNHQENKSSHRLNVFMRSDEELKIVKGFFKEYALPDDEYSPWIEIHRFQQEVLDKRLEEKHKKETDKIDAVMDPIKEAPKEFFDWVWDTGMSFARYLIYKEVEKGKALCECTHCKEIGIVDRKNIRLRNNEKGICPFCGSRVTIKAKGRMPAQTQDERWFVYVDPTKDGFVFRYFKAHQSMRSDSYVDMLINKGRRDTYCYEKPGDTRRTDEGGK